MNEGHDLDTGVIVGLVVCGLIAIALSLLFGWLSQREARNATSNSLSKQGGYSVEWNDISYIIPRGSAGLRLFQNIPKHDQVTTDDKVILDNECLRSF